ELRRDRRHSRMRASKLIAVSFDQLHLRIVRVQRMPVRASGDLERIVVEIDPFVEHRADDRDVEPLRMKLLHAVEVHEQGERADLGLARLRAGLEGQRDVDAALWANALRAAAGLAEKEAVARIR